MERKDYTGMRFGVVVAVSYVGKDPNSWAKIWKVKCDCGKERFVKNTHFQALKKRSGCSCRLNKKHKLVWNGKRGHCRSCNVFLSGSFYFKCADCSSYKVEYHDLEADYQFHNWR